MSFSSLKSAKSIGFGGIGLLCLWWLMSQVTLIAHLGELSQLSLLPLLLMGILFTACGGPRQLLAFASGAVMHSAAMQGSMVKNPVLSGIYGGLLSTLATLTGAMLCFYVARLCLRAPLQQKFAAHYQRLSPWLVDSAWLKVMWLRVLPVGSNLVTNLVCGISPMSLKSFVLGSGVGYLPQMLLFSLLGAGFVVAEQTQFIVSGLLLLGCSWLTFVFARKPKHR